MAIEELTDKDGVQYLVWRNNYGTFVIKELARDETTDIKYGDGAGCTAYL